MVCKLYNFKLYVIHVSQHNRLYQMSRRILGHLQHFGVKINYVLANFEVPKYYRFQANFKEFYTLSIQ